jgi:hypothetical protein
MSENGSQRELDTDQGIAGLEQAVGDREQAIEDREQGSLDRTQVKLDRDIATGGQAPLGDPGQRRRQAETELAQQRRAASQDMLDDAQRGRDDIQAMLDGQQTQLDYPDPARTEDPATAGRHRGDELFARAEAMEARALAAAERAAEARRRAHAAMEREA